MALIRRRGQQPPPDAAHLEARRQTLAHATEEWLSLLREMEEGGEVADPRYERYYRAYVEAKHQEKRADLELFNLRHGLVR